MIKQNACKYHGKTTWCGFGGFLIFWWLLRLQGSQGLEGLSVKAPRLQGLRKAPKIRLLSPRRHRLQAPRLLWPHGLPGPGPGAADEQRRAGSDVEVIAGLIV